MKKTKKSTKDKAVPKVAWQLLELAEALVIAAMIMAVVVRCWSTLQ